MKGWIPALIILLVAAVAIFLLMPKIYEVMIKTSDRESCRTSVDLRAGTKIADKLILTDLSCKTQEKKINSKNEKDIYEELAYAAYDCWYQFGEGEVDFLTDYDWGYGNNWCFICSRFDFDRKVQQEFSNLDGFYDYLSKEKIPLDDKQQTFLEYMNADASEKLDPPDISMDIDTSEPFYVVFFGDKRQNFWKDMMENADAFEWGVFGASCWAGGAAGATLGVVGGPFAPITVPVGVIVGCLGGAIIGGSVEMMGRKTEFHSMVYLGNADEIINKCGQ